jgi:hypothetical protein
LDLDLILELGVFLGVYGTEGEEWTSWGWVSRRCNGLCTDIESTGTGNRYLNRRFSPLSLLLPQVSLHRPKVLVYQGRPYLI